MAGLLWNNMRTASVAATEVEEIKVLDRASEYLNGPGREVEEVYTVIGLLANGNSFAFGRFSNRKEADLFTLSLRLQMKDATRRG